MKSLIAYTSGVCLAIVLSGVVSGCKKSSDDPAPIQSLTIPASYDSTGFGANTQQERRLTSDFASFVGEVKKGRPTVSAGVSSPGAVLSGGALKSKLESGNPSVWSLMTHDYHNWVDHWVNEAEEASKDGAFDLSDTASGKGGYYGAYLFNEKGTEPEQILDKGLYAAFMYNQAVSVMSGTLSTASVDKLIVWFGSSPVFSATNTASKTSFPDAFSALYAARRDNLDGTGLYLKAKKSLIKAKAAISAGQNYNTDRNEALKEFRQAWEKAIFATVVNYNYDASSKLSSGNSASYPAALHSLSENIGFIAGWKGIPAEHRIITNAQIDELLTYLQVTSYQSGKLYKNIASASQFNAVKDLDKLNTRIKEIYGFSDSDMNGFKTNWISAQNR